MRTIRTKVYKFSELSKDAQQKAIESFSDINVEYDWHELTTGEQEGELIKQGFEGAKIMFSGFASQGDGACFTCSNIDFRIFLNGKYNELATEISANITHNWRYYFATSTTVNLNIEGDGLSDDDYNEIEQAVKDERERLGNEIYRTLENECDYLTSKEAIIETIEANDYEFTKDGKRF